MRLLDYLKERGIDEETFAETVGMGATGRAVRKWKYGETTPRLPTLLRIQEITDGIVTPADFLAADIDRPASPEREAAA